jgi:hypothetical protein
MYRGNDKQRDKKKKRKKKKDRKTERRQKKKNLKEAPHQNIGGASLSLVTL